MKDVQFVIGLDTAAWGPVVLQQPQNDAMIRFFADPVPHPVVFGFFARTDWVISHDTSEIQSFYERGLPGLAVEDPTAICGKHSSEDNIVSVRPGSLQPMGDQTLVLARSYEDLQLSQPAAVDRSYFTLCQNGVIHYPANWNIALGRLSFIKLFAWFLWMESESWLPGEHLQLRQHRSS